MNDHGPPDGRRPTTTGSAAGREIGRATLGNMLAPGSDENVVDFPHIDLDGVPWAQFLEALTRRATTQRRRAFTVLDGGAS